MSDIENTNVETTVEDIKPIVLRFADTHQEYTLEFNRQSVAFAEKRGFPLTPFNTEEIMNTVRTD